MHLVNSLLDALLFCLLNALRLFAGATTFLSFRSWLFIIMFIFKITF